MIINRVGAQFTYEGVTYTVGDKILATDASEYEGLFGEIHEIRTEEDQETENDTPDFHCHFYPPFDPRQINNLESRFSALYRYPKKLEDISLDEVIMAPEMIHVIVPANTTRVITAYRVEEEWAIDGDNYGTDVTLALDEVQAKLRLAELVHQETVEGCIQNWASDPRFETEITSLYYECWLRDDYGDNHYKVAILSEQITISNELYEGLGRRYLDGILRDHFAEQIECWEELEDLTPAQIAEMIASPTVPSRIKKQLRENGYLIESYWESISEASFDLVKKYRKSQGLPPCPETDMN